MGVCCGCAVAERESRGSNETTLSVSERVCPHRVILAFTVSVFVRFPILLGCLSEQGAESMQQDAVHAVYLYKLATDAGSGMAMNNLGNLL